VPNRDPDKAASRFLTALRRNAQGLENQRQRILDRESNAERLLPDDSMPVINYGTDPGLDLDYYIYELARLQDVGKSVIKVFGQPPELVEARDKFEAGIRSCATSATRSPTRTTTIGLTMS
jgi:hypothetical protein